MADKQSVAAHRNRTRGRDQRAARGAHHREAELSSTEASAHDGGTPVPCFTLGPVTMKFLVEVSGRLSEA